MAKISALAASILRGVVNDGRFGLPEASLAVEMFAELSVAHAGHRGTGGQNAPGEKPLNFLEPTGLEHGFAALCDAGGKCFLTGIEYHHEEREARSRRVFAAQRTDWTAQALAEPQRSKHANDISRVDLAGRLGVQGLQCRMGAAGALALSPAPLGVEFEALAPGPRVAVELGQGLCLGESQ